MAGLCPFHPQSSPITTPGRRHRAELQGTRAGLQDKPRASPEATRSGPSERPMATPQCRGKGAWQNWWLSLGDVPVLSPGVENQFRGRGSSTLRLSPAGACLAVHVLLDRPACPGSCRGSPALLSFPQPLSLSPPPRCPRWAIGIQEVRSPPPPLTPGCVCLNLSV